MFNPFIVESEWDSENRKPLVNIATGLVAPPEVCSWLNGCKQSGSIKLKDFLNKRIRTETEDHFDPITKTKILNLSHHAIRKQPFQKLENWLQLTFDRQIMGRLVVVSQTRKVDLETLFGYELSSVTLTLFNPDGTMRECCTSDLLKELESDPAVDELEETDETTLTVIDFMVLVKMICTETSKCNSFGDLSDALLKAVMGMFKYGSNVDVVCDRYDIKDSIKGSERVRRGQVRMQKVKIFSESTPIPKQRSKLLSNPKNKQNICNFVFNDWTVNARQLLKENEKLTLSGGFKDGQTALQITRHSQANIDELRSDHEEADSRMFAHVSHAMELYSPGRVIIWSIDTDVAAICPRAMLLLDIDIKELYFKTGVKSKKRFIPMHAVSSEFGHSISLVLPVAHALTGCDSNSGAFSGIGKRSMLNILKSDERMADAILDSLGVYPDEVDEEAMRACIKFVSNLYMGKGTYQSTTKMRKIYFPRNNLSVIACRQLNQS